MKKFIVVLLTLTTLLLSQEEAKPYSKTQNPKPKIVSLTLSSPKMELKHNSTTTINLNAKQTNSKTLTITNNIEWIIEDNSIVEITDTTIKALKEGSSTIQAKVDNITSNKITLIVYKEINKHRLPPKPDPKLNNSTLLGIDTNNNGVRDDVERWIYETYKDKHPIHIDIAMQAGRAYKLVLESPERASKIYPVLDAASSCEAYYEVCVNKDNKLFISDWINNKYFRKNIYFNTKKRIETYYKYDKLLSGDSYTIPRCSEKKQFCDFNTSKYE